MLGSKKTFFYICPISSFLLNKIDIFILEWVLIYNYPVYTHQHLLNLIPITIPGLPPRQFSHSEESENLTPSCQVGATFYHPSSNNQLFSSLSLSFSFISSSLGLIYSHLAFLYRFQNAVVRKKIVHGKFFITLKQIGAVNCSHTFVLKHNIIRGYKENFF